MAAALLTDRPFTLANTPARSATSRRCSRYSTAWARAAGTQTARCCIEGGAPAEIEAPYDLVRTMRASFAVLSACCSRAAATRGVAASASCAIGARLVDQHLKGMAALGAKIGSEGGYVEARASRLRRRADQLDVRTVNGHAERADGGVLAEGVSGSRTPPASRGPSSSPCCAMGARIDQAAFEHLIVQGCRAWAGVNHTWRWRSHRGGTLLASAACL